VKLYPNNFPGKEGEFVAHTVAEKPLTYEEVCASAKERGGYTGSLDDLIEHVAIFLREAAHHLCDGYEVNFGGLFVIFVNVGGVFLNARDPVDKTKHKINFHFRTLSGLRKLAEQIEVVSEGLADSSGYIMEVKDVATGLVNDVVTKGGIFILSGDKIKITGTGTPSKTGVFFLSPGSPDIAIKAAGNLAVNDPSQIIGTVPELLPDKDWYIEVCTDFSGTTGKPLKDIRRIRSTFTVRQA
jgi:hypothetical protein